MPKHLLIRAARHSLVLTLVLGGLLPAMASETRQAQQPPSQRRLILSGSDRALWLVVGEWDGSQEEFKRRYLYRDAGSDRVHPVAAAPQAQRIGCFATAGSTLHVFFEQGAHVRFSKARRWSGHQLPGGVVPMALAGESRGRLSRLWAIVPADTADEVETAWRERQARTQQPSDQPRETARDLSISALPLMDDRTKVPARLVFYDGVAWQPGMDLPDNYCATEQVWLAADGGRLHLFWIASRKPDQVQYALHNGRHWSPGAGIALPGSVQSASVAVLNKQLVLAALLKQPQQTQVYGLQWSRAVVAPADESWDEPRSLLDQDGHELLLASGSAVGLFGDRLAIMRFNDRDPELGLWPAGLGGAPDQFFEPLPAMSDSEMSASRRGARDLAATLIVAALLLMLFWKRQETIASPLELPANLQVAGPARRGLAFLIDAAPAAAIALWIWYEPITGFYTQVNAAAKAGEPVQSAPAQVLWAWFWFRVIYTSYSICFEAWMASTPGKRLMGCFVLSETLSRAGFLQIVIRNAARMVELEPFLKIWPFLLIVFFTRNRQRLGDLLARTVVVERQANLIADEHGDTESERMPEDHGR